MKKELSEKVIRVRRVSDRVMAVVVFAEDVLRLICGMLQKVKKVWKKISILMIS